MHVAITGAGGDVGRTLVPAFESDRLTLLTHSEHDDIDSCLLDTTDRAAYVSAVEGVDVLVHLAWAPADRERWSETLEENIEMVTNAFDAALEHDIDRVVVASSAHVAGMYNRDDPSAFESTVEQPTETVDPRTPPRPDSLYGVAKVSVEALASFYADRHDLDVVVVRIGWLMTESELKETQSDADDRHRFARAMYLSPPDCRALFRAAAEAPLSESPVIAHGISRNGDRFLTLSETMQRLGYRPRDDASEILDS
jgi:L-arabinose 1-dehydrogenase [NAD(P)+]